jgi:hypothetical protein
VNHKNAICALADEYRAIVFPDTKSLNDLSDAQYEVLLGDKFHEFIDAHPNRALACQARREQWALEEQIIAEMGIPPSVEAN